MQDSALNIFSLADPANLELPAYGMPSGASKSALTVVEGGSGSVPGMLFSSMAFSISVHVLVAFLGLAVASSPQLPVQVMSISLMPGMKASGTPGGPPGPLVHSEPSAGPQPEALPAPPPPDPQVQKKPVDPAPKTKMDQAKPLPVNTEKKPRKEPVTTREKRPEPLAPAVVRVDEQPLHNATTSIAAVSGAGKTPAVTASACPQLTPWGESAQMELAATGRSTPDSAMPTGHASCNVSCPDIRSWPDAGGERAWLCCACSLPHPES